MSKLKRVALTFLLIMLLGQADAGDYPQWRGVGRDGHSTDKDLIQKWPATGPKLAWTFDKTGFGYSGPAVVGDTLYILGANDTKNGDEEFALAINTKDGKQIWRQKFSTFYPNGWGGGPRSTPIVDGTNLYVLGGNSDLACLETKSGKIVWQKSLIKDFNGRQQKIWGYSESPLIDGDLVVTTPGGAKGAILALNKKTGATVWRSTDVTDDAAYSSIIVAEIGGVRQYITLTANGTVSVDAKTGKKLWSDKLGANNIAVIPTAIAWDNYVFVTSNYPDGTAGLLKITKDKDTFKVEKVYDCSKDLKNHHGGVIKVGKYIYGYNGNQRGQWVCLEAETGKVMWSEENALDKGSLGYANGSLYLFGQKNGTCIKIAASEKGFTAEGKMSLPKEDAERSKQGGCWTHPVVANGKLYLRDQRYLFAFDVKK